ncbi:hypothetical protein WN944_006704 [Citrus x changshan-huyou]|uniref:Uncharacterized protein n=1 Tax=Citrus x changshan-huyou TaxID=2935761 RepID=A0AAP0MR32_9ROSI
MLNPVYKSRGRKHTSCVCFVRCRSISKRACAGGSWGILFISSIRIFYTLVLATSGGAATFSVGSIIHYLCMYGGSYSRNQSNQFCDDARVESTATKKKSSERMTQLCVHL